jgi:hypothetical protein
MVDSKDGAKLKGWDGYLHLPRNFISVEFEGRLDVDILAYSKSGEIAAQEFVRFYPKVSKISQENCSIGGVTVVITVAWSRHYRTRPIRRWPEALGIGQNALGVGLRRGWPSA